LSAGLGKGLDLADLADLDLAESLGEVLS